MKDNEKKGLSMMDSAAEDTEKKNAPEDLNTDDLNKVVGGVFEDFPRVKDNDYDEEIKERI